MAITLIGIGYGNSFSAKAGETHPEVNLSVAANGTYATLNDRKVALKDGMLVFWHQNSAGTFYGLCSPVEMQTMKANEAPSITDRIVIATSSSGGFEIAGAIAVIPEEGIAIVTSGYQGRSGWRIRVVEKNGTISFDGSPVSYRAMFAPVEEL